MPFSMTNINLLCLLPEIILLLGATAAIFLNGTGGYRKALFFAAFTVSASLAAAVTLCHADTGGFAGFIVRDETTLLFIVLTDMASLAVIALSQDGDAAERSGGEYFGLLLYALLGMHIMAAGRDLLVVFLGVEILALPLYVLVAFNRRSVKGMEGAVKYFLLGSFSSAVFLLGLVFFYGATGATAIAASPGASGIPALMFAGLALVIVGIGFKLAAVPFHMWAPDAYEGAPVSVAAFLSVAPKIAAFAFLLNLCMTLSASGDRVVEKIILIMSAASMMIGNFAALRQSGFIRMLAYSGIAHVGYMLIAIPSLQSEGGEALSFYLLVYIFMNLGAFAAALAVGPRGEKSLLIDELAGLAARRPLLAFALAVFMVSLAGIPPTGGFFAKFCLFKAGIAAGHLPVVILAIIMSIVSLFYYLRVVMVMYMRSPADRPTVLNSIASPAAAVIAVMVLLVFWTGIQPDKILKLIQAVF